MLQVGSLAFLLLDPGCYTWIQPPSTLATLGEKARTAFSSYHVVCNCDAPASAGPRKKRSRYGHSAITAGTNSCVCMRERERERSMCVPLIWLAAPNDKSITTWKATYYQAAGRSLLSIRRRQPCEGHHRPRVGVLRLPPGACTVVDPSIAQSCMNSRLTVVVVVVFLFLSLGTAGRYHRQEGDDDATNINAKISRKDMRKAQIRVEELLKSHVSLVTRLGKGKMRIDCPHLALSHTHTNTRRPGTVLQGLSKSLRKILRMPNLRTTTWSKRLMRPSGTRGANCHQVLGIVLPKLTITPRNCAIGFGT